MKLSKPKIIGWVKQRDLRTGKVCARLPITEIKVLNYNDDYLANKVIKDRERKNILGKQKDL